jgi:hypothetical protein
LLNKTPTKKEIDRCIDMLSQPHINILERNGNGKIKFTQNGLDIINSFLNQEEVTIDEINKRLDERFDDLKIEENDIDDVLEVTGWEFIIDKLIKKLSLKNEFKKYRVNKDILLSLIASTWKTTLEKDDIIDRVSKYIQ